MPCRYVSRIDCRTVNPSGHYQTAFGVSYHSSRNVYPLIDPQCARASYRLRHFLFLGDRHGDDAHASVRQRTRQSECVDIRQGAAAASASNVLKLELLHDRLVDVADSPRAMNLVHQCC